MSDTFYKMMGHSTVTVTVIIAIHRIGWPKPPAGARPLRLTQMVLTDSARVRMSMQRPTQAPGLSFSAVPSQPVGRAQDANVRGCGRRRAGTRTVTTIRNSVEERHQRSVRFGESFLQLAANARARELSESLCPVSLTARSDYPSHPEYSE